jgi:hypothetical protein
MWIGYQNHQCKLAVLKKKICIATFQPVVGTQKRKTMPTDIALISNREYIASNTRMTTPSSPHKSTLLSR